MALSNDFSSIRTIQKCINSKYKFDTNENEESFG